MSDFDELENAKAGLERLTSKGDWFWLGLFFTIILIILFGWVMLIVNWPITFGIITLVLVMPFLLGRVLVWRAKSKIKRLEKKLNTKDDAVEI